MAKSLVVADIRGDRSHYRLLDTTRAYALEKLHGSGEYPDAARRHAKYYRGFFANAEAESELKSQAEWLAVYGRHIDNVRTSLDWAFSPEGDAQTGVALTAAAVPLWVQLSLLAECRERTELALARLDETAADAAAAAHAAIGGAWLVADVWRWQGSGGRPCLDCDLAARRAAWRQ